MGLYDRDYTQYDAEETPRFGANISNKPAWLILLVITVAIFLIDGIFFSRNHQLMDQMSVDSTTIYHPLTWWRWLTYGFSHATTINHVLMNMLGLFFFGSAVEQRLGRGEFARFYLASIVLGGLFWSLRGLFMEQVLGTEFTGSVRGASGGVEAVVILFCFLYPQATLYLMFVLPIKAWVAGILFVALNLGGALFANDNTAYDVHLAGIGFATCYYLAGWRLDFLAPDRFKQTLNRLRRPRLRLHDPEKKLADEAIQADRILEKIHREGEASLTAAERKLLERYSRRMRQKSRDY